MRRLGLNLVIAALTTLLGGMGSAYAEKRVALVIGNSAYLHVTKLPNPTNDVTAIALLLKNAGFEVVETRQDLGTADMRRTIRDFAEVAREADMAVVFYAGHGIEVDGANYLVPVDATLERDIDVEDETVSLDRVLQVIEPAKRLRLVILDACRDNPFRAMKRTLATRSIGRGLARVEPVKSDTLIAFAAKAGSTAADGKEAHSPFTAALMKHLATPGLDLRIAFGRVRDEVMKSTDNKQEPFVYGSLGGTTVALLPSHDDPSYPTQASGPQILPPDPASRDYELAAQVGTKEAWDSFLEKHDKGFYADLARAHVKRISTQPTSVTPDEGAPERLSKTNKQPPVAQEPRIKKAEGTNAESNLQCCLRVSSDIKQSRAMLMRACRQGIRTFNYCN